MTYQVEIKITDTERPAWFLHAEGDVDELDFSFAPGCEISFKWATAHLQKYHSGGPVTPAPGYTYPKVAPF